MNKYITIQACIKKLNISDSTVRRAIKAGRVKTKSVGNKILINYNDALKEFKPESIQKEEPKPQSNEVVDMLKEQVNYLKEQIKIKDEQIASKDVQLNQQLTAKDNQIEEMQKQYQNTLALVAPEDKLKLLKGIQLQENKEEKPKKRKWYQLWKETPPSDSAGDS
jgi:excisionase family DNA binding protein